MQKLFKKAKGSWSSLADNLDTIIRFGVALLLAAGVYFVIAPFLPALIIAVILVVTTWPLYARLHKWMGSKDTPPAIIMVLAMLLLVVLPVSWGLIGLAQVVPVAIAWVKEWIHSGFPLPPEIQSIPYVGEWLSHNWMHRIEPSLLTQNLGKFAEPVSGWIINLAVNVTTLIVQLALVTFIIFFLYRDGIWFANRARVMVDRISGALSGEMTDILVNTTRSVILGLVGNAVLQGLVAGIGFYIADVPGPIILGVIVMVMSVIPIGPPLVWGPVAVWLYTQGQTGMAIFIVLWGSLAVSSIDNFVKPLLMQRGTKMPFWLIFLGVFGGVIAFGVLGLILGPVLLALAQATIRAWLDKQNADDEDTHEDESLSIAQ